MFFTLIKVIYSIFFCSKLPIIFFFFKIRTSHTAILFFLTEPRVSTLRVQKHCVNIRYGNLHRSYWFRAVRVKTPA